MMRNKTLVALVAAGFALSIHGTLARADGAQSAHDGDSGPEQGPVYAQPVHKAPDVIAQQAYAPPPPPPVQHAPNPYEMVPPFAFAPAYRGGVGAVGYTRRPEPF